MTNCKAIMAVLKEFYQDLYANRDSDFDEDVFHSFQTQNVSIPKLSDN